MKDYLFRTTVQIKNEAQARKYWISNDYIQPVIALKAESFKDALLAYRNKVQSAACVTISDTALNRPQPIYNNDRCIGYCITGKTEIDDDNGNWTNVWLELWVEIDELSKPAELSKHDF